MFIPLYDSNSLRHIKLQYVTIGLIVLNVIIYLLTSVQSPMAAQATVMSFGFIPSVVHDIAELPPNLVIIPEGLTYLSYSFFHGDIFHLGGNMLFLWVFGDNVEDALGHVKFLLFYLLCAVAGAAVHGLVVPDSQAPLIGASGAVAGVITAYLMLHPRVKVWVLAFARIPLRIPAWIAIAAWIALQFVMFFVPDEQQISFAAHIGGILAGAVLVLILRRRGVPLFDKEIVTPKAVKIKEVEPIEPIHAEQPSPWGRR